MNREEKNLEINALEDVFSASASILVVHYQGVNVKQLTDLRNKMREKNCNVKVAKNTLARIASEKTGCKDLTPLLTGATLLVYSEDPIAPFKVLLDASKAVPAFQVLGGLLLGKLVSGSDVEKIAAIPSLDTLRSGLLGLIKSAPTRFVRTLAQPSVKILNVINANYK